jgi:transcriptional regulator with GAF, ATPase, and Fis domain
MMEVEQQLSRLHATEVLAAILQEFSAITDYRTLRDSLPRRLAHLLQCRCVLLYQRAGETLQFAAGTFDDKPGWSASLLAVAHINPIDLKGNTLEAQAWRTRHAVTSPVHSPYPTFVAVPLIYRQRGIGVLVAIRSDRIETQPLVLDEISQSASSWGPTDWSEDEVPVVEVAANIIAMLLENTRLIERDRDRIRELSLLNIISSQMNSSMHNLERLHAIVIQRTKEIADADMCALLLPSTPINTLTWFSITLQEKLLHHFAEQNDANVSPFILERFVDDFNKSLGRNVRRIAAETQRLLLAYHWPGNVRELKNVIERAMILSTNDELLPSHLPREIVGSIDIADGSQVDPWEQWLSLRPPGQITLEEVNERVERYFVNWALETSSRNRTRAASLLGLSKVDQLRYLMRKYSID